MLLLNGVNKVLFDQNSVARGLHIMSLYFWLLTALAGLLITFFIVWIMNSKGSLGSLRKKGKGNSVLLCGQSGTGKTTLFLRMVTTHQPPTVTSAACNKAIIEINNLTHLSLVDIPGNRKVRESLYEDELSDAHSIIFMLNGDLPGEFYKDVPFLLRIFNDALLRGLPFLLIINRSEDSPEVVRKLEEECKSELKKHAADSQCDEVDSSQHTELLKKFDHDCNLFSFNSLKEVITLEIISRIPHDDKIVDSVNSWLATIA